MLTLGKKKSAYLQSNLFIMLFVFGFLFSLISCKKSETSTAPREKITIAYTTLANSVLVHIAFAKGYFVEEGLDAIPQPHAFGKLALAEVVAGKADIAAVADTPIIFAVMNGEKVDTLAVIQTSNKNEAIVAKRDHGIIQPGNLKGKKIGVPLGTTAHFFVDSFLIVYGVASENVTLVDMKPTEMAVALDSGRVDAVSTFNPTLKQLERSLGKNGIVFGGESLYTETFCVAAMQEYVKKHPETIKKFLRALIKAELFVKVNDKEAQNLVADFIKADKVVLAETWKIMNFRVALDQALLLDFEDQTRWVLKNKLTTGRQMPNYLDYIYIDGLYAVKPDAARIIR